MWSLAKVAEFAKLFFRDFVGVFQALFALCRYKKTVDTLVDDVTRSSDPAKEPHSPAAESSNPGSDSRE